MNNRALSISKGLGLLVAALGMGMVLAIVAVSSGLPQAGAVWRTFNQHSSEPGLQIAYGNFTDVKALHKFGRNISIDSAIPEDVWDVGGTYVFPTAAETIAIVSTDVDDDGDPADTGARTFMIEGLDTNYLEITEAVTLNGTTPVNTTLLFLRVNRAYVLTAGSTQTNEGVISAVNTTTGDNLFSIPLGKGQTTLGLYTVPANTKLLITQMHTSIGSGAAASEAVIELVIRPFGGAFRAIFYDAVENDGLSSNNQEFTPPMLIAAKTDIKLRATVSKNSSDVNGGFGGYLVTIQ